MTVQVVVEDEHSNTITTVKPDVIVTLRADRGIVIGEWIKTRYTDVQLNFDRICVCACCFHAGKCQPQQTESMLAQFMQTVAQAPNLATGGRQWMAGEAVSLERTRTQNGCNGPDRNVTVCVALFYYTDFGGSLCTVPGLHRERAKGDVPTIIYRRRPNLTLSPFG